MIHEKEEYTRVVEEMIRSGIVPAPDDSDVPPEENDPDQDSSTTASEPPLLQQLCGPLTV